ncbi:MAG: 2-amino-4-hydroxy-6-hydroxymethyldihydropteridine diphosphokinase [Gammaproteobacteria bacterium]|nr:MAG: 2-amino-4-hydroxy-6-hydroxymethyldihydropteridine diphosphokinase [Gammaproteobacteria bacterium]
MIRCYVGLGSNLAGPRRQVAQALQELGRMRDCRLAVTSSLYLSQPMGPQDQPEYVNAVAALDSLLPPLALLAELQAIERAHGRVREGERWGPRTLDLDLLLYGDLVMESEALTLPHPGIGEREFVLHPLAEIAPELEVPGLGRVRDLLSRVDDRGIRRLEETGDHGG